MINAKNVDEFIALQAQDKREMLELLRELILKTVPKAEEVVSYGVPCYKYNGSLVGFGVQKKGVSFYTMNPSMPALFKTDLIGYKFSSSTIHINTDQKIPSTTLKKIIKERLRENDARAAAKAKIKK